jgi:UDP-N-acetylmuramoylalanine--D-glutamate ligase
VLAITGSNGKSTVTALTGRARARRRPRTIVAGNIGDAVLDMLPADSRWPDVFVLELSSFQLETTSSLVPTAAACSTSRTTISTAIAASTTMPPPRPASFGRRHQVLNRDDPRCLALRLPGRLVQTFGAACRNGGGVGVSSIAREGRDARERGWRAAAPCSLPCRTWRWWADTMRSTRWRRSRSPRPVVKIDRAVLASLVRFAGLPHRCRRSPDAQGVLFVDDSKGTTVVATRAAHAGLGRPAFSLRAATARARISVHSRRRSTRHSARCC